MSKLWAGECETRQGSGPGDRCGTSSGGRGSWVGIFPWDEGPAPLLGQQESLQGRCRGSHQDLLAGGRPCLHMGALEGLCSLFRATGRWAGPGPQLCRPQRRQLQRKSSSSATAVDASEEPSFPAVCVPVSREWLANWWAFGSWSRRQSSEPYGPLESLCKVLLGSHRPAQVSLMQHLCAVYLIHSNEAIFVQQWT